MEYYTGLGALRRRFEQVLEGKKGLAKSLSWARA